MNLRMHTTVGACTTLTHKNTYTHTRTDMDTNSLAEIEHLRVWTQSSTVPESKNYNTHAEVFV